MADTEIATMKLITAPMAPNDSGETPKIQLASTFSKLLVLGMKNQPMYKNT